MPRVEQQLVRCFQNRLFAANQRTSLLHVRTASPFARLLDVQQLAGVQNDLPRRVLEAVVGGDSQVVSLKLCLEEAKHDPAGQASHDRTTATRAAAAARRGRRREGHAELYHLLEERIRRYCELARRETGCHALWLGYPLLYAKQEDAAVLAPVLLWPARIELDRERLACFRISRDESAGPGKMNRALAVWLQSRLGVSLKEVDADELESRPWEQVRCYLEDVCQQLEITTPSDIGQELQMVPTLERLERQSARSLVYAAALGYFRLPFEALGGDLNELGRQKECSGPVSGFVTAVRPTDAPTATPPAEAGRHLVTEADFSQERAVWQAREEPGLVIHGPPGTGKSQTIVNIIADALARQKTVLMVCQKETATRVVFERLRSVGLADLCLSVHDPDGERKQVFEQILQQVARLRAGQGNAPAALESHREELSRQIEVGESLLDDHARALHEADEAIGIPYGELMGRLLRVFYVETRQAVRQLNGLPSWRGHAASELEQLADAVRDAGRQFQAADWARNPWKYCQTATDRIASVVLRQEVAKALQCLAELARWHEERIEQVGGAGISLPTDLRGFARLASRVLQRLRSGGADLAGGMGLRARWYVRWLCFWHGGEHPWLRDLLKANSSPHAGETLAAYLDELERALERAPLAEETLTALGLLEAYLQGQALEPGAAVVRQGLPLEAWLDQVREGFDRLLDLQGYEAARGQHDGRLKELVEALQRYEEALLDGASLPHPPCAELAANGRWWSALVRFPAYEEWRQELVERHPDLLTTPGAYPDRVADLRTALETKRQLEPQLIRAAWTVRQRQWLGQNWGAWFRLNGNQNVRSRRLREAVHSSIDCGLLDLRPCWLVGPDVAAQLFPFRAALFDVVIFDEASQCPLEQAIPAVYRGKTLVVVGDEHQLPPTSFFNTQLAAAEAVASEENEDEAATNERVDLQIRRNPQDRIQFLQDVESLLEAAIDTFRGEKLLVHYRSADPALIEFSNHAFYGGELETPPPCTVRHTPIQYVWVGGTYEQRRNRAEAEQVVEILKSLWLSDSPPPTIGVVTFNQPQRELIENLIQQACDADTRFAACKQREEERIDRHNQYVGFFVRNLENVQGDERDLMIFSTTFGRNPDGGFYRRFGPIGVVKGHRRLNVAVTRARLRNVILSSMPIEQITPDLPGPTIPPAGYLQKYLAYARAVSGGDQAGARRVLEGLPSTRPRPPASKNEPESPLEEEVYGVLIEQGYQVDCQVGEAGFRIDLAVRNPASELGYVLGIECDGATYHSDRSARIRDVWRQGILEDLGWRIHRVWSTRWWNSRDNEIQRLLEAIEATLKNVEKDPCPVDQVLV